MPWGEAHTSGVGSTSQVEDAHVALDACGVKSGPLAIRVLEAVGMIDRLLNEKPKTEIIIAEDVRTYPLPDWRNPGRPFETTVDVEGDVL